MTDLLLIFVALLVFPFSGYAVHHRDLTVESTLGRGRTFTLQLPPTW